jgi:hypothetical protein
METINELWWEIDYPTPSSRTWEKARRAGSSACEDPLFCRSVDVLTAADGAGPSAVRFQAGRDSPQRRNAAPRRWPAKLR